MQQTPILSDNISFVGKIPGHYFRSWI